MNNSAVFTSWKLIKYDFFSETSFLWICWRVSSYYPNEPHVTGLKLFSYSVLLSQILETSMKIENIEIKSYAWGYRPSSLVNQKKKINK